MSNIFAKISKQLFPSGRVWNLKESSIFFKLLEGYAESEQRVYDAAKILETAILPDNDDFTEEDATNWERSLGLLNQPYLTLAERKVIIERKINHPGDIPARQHYLYLEGQLQKAGFDVYVHENRPTVNNPIASYYASFNYAQQVYGNTGITGATILANSVNDENYNDFMLGDANHLRAIFFVGGATYPNFTDISAQRKKEFRELILKIKPAQTVAVLLINYV